MEKKEYVSVTGAVTIDDAKSLVSGFKDEGYTMNSEHAPAIGILVVEKSLNGLPTRNLRFPKFKDVPSLFAAIGKEIFGVIHYNTKNFDTLAEQIERALAHTYKAGLCSMLQLNTDWPPREQVEKIKCPFPALNVILQISYKAMLDLTNKEISNRVSSYGRCLDYVLIDPSRGGGVDFDVEHSAQLYLEIKSQRPEYSIVFAGGLSGDNVEPVLERIIGRLKTTKFSIDAEGKLRDKISNEFFGNDILDINKVGHYLRAVARVLR